MNQTLTSPCHVLLSSGVINEVIVECSDLGPIPKEELILYVQNRKRPWKILTKFLYISPNTNKIVLPIVTTKNYMLQPNEIIDYFTIIGPWQALCLINAEWTDYDTGKKLLKIPNCTK